MAKALTEPEVPSSILSVSLDEYMRVPVELSTRQLGLVGCSKTPDGDKGAGAAIDLEQVNAAAVAGWEIDLGAENIVKRGTEGADVGD